MLTLVLGGCFTVLVWVCGLGVVRGGGRKIFEGILWVNGFLILGDALTVLGVVLTDLGVVLTMLGVVLTLLGVV
jgi:hypothetical protein